jgi:hypothetical protein
MKRTSVAALLLLALPGLTHANPPRQCFAYMGFGGYGMGLFSKLHQHGPLFNYGPYYGYPPFEPYGPWNAYLQYNPWYYYQGDRVRGHHFGHRCGSDHCRGMHACWLRGGWFQGRDNLSCGQSCDRHWGLCRKAQSCNPCTASSCCSAPPAAAKPAAPEPKEVKPIAFDPTDDPAVRFTGVGFAETGAVYYSGLPALNPAVIPADY